MTWKKIRRKGVGTWEFSQDHDGDPSPSDYLHHKRTRLSVQEDDDGTLSLELSKPPHFGDGNALLSADDITRAMAGETVSPDVGMSATPGARLSRAGRNELICVDGDGDAHRLPLDLTCELLFPRGEAPQ